MFSGRCRSIPRRLQNQFTILRPSLELLLLLPPPLFPLLLLLLLLLPAPLLLLLLLVGLRLLPPPGVLLPLETLPAAEAAAEEEDEEAPPALLGSIVGSSKISRISFTMFGYRSCARDHFAQPPQPAANTWLLLLFPDELPLPGPLRRLRRCGGAERWDG